MSDSTLTPFPETATPAVSEKSPPRRQPIESMPSLSGIREGWSKQQADIPSLPIAAASLPTEEKSSTQTISGLSQLPTQDSGTAEKKPPRPAETMPSLPGFFLPDEKTESAPQASLTAMPTLPEQDHSLPMLRDQLAPAPEAEAKTPAPAPDTSSAPAEPATPPAPSPERVIPTPPTPAAERPTPSHYTDKDLQEALDPILQPLIAPKVDQFLYTPNHGIHTYLEPMLRSTVRRAIAEQMEDSTPFQQVSGWDKFAWKLRALIGSNSYEDIVFTHTKRYRVEEVYLLRKRSRSLISYASNDPNRHIKPSRVQSTVKKIAAKISKKESAQQTSEDGDSPAPITSIPWQDKRNLIIRHGEHSILVAVVHGPKNALLRADLDYALRQAEERFGETLEEESDIHLEVLQPLLEGCLLIQAPGIPN